MCSPCAHIFKTDVGRLSVYMGVVCILFRKLESRMHGVVCYDGGYSDAIIGIV